MQMILVGEQHLALLNLTLHIALKIASSEQPERFFHL